MIRTITKEFQWDCAHKLHDKNLSIEENQRIFGKCNNIHGHTYKLFVTVASENNDLTNGMIVNFVDLKRVVNMFVVDRFDHVYLNDDELYKNRLSTCENQVEDIWEELDEPLYDHGCILKEIKLYETPTSFATFSK